MWRNVIFRRRKKFVVCQNGKYGYYKFGKKCDKIHLTDVCDENENWKEIFCDNRHPLSLIFFEKFRRCKFGTFCSYSHVFNEEEQLKR